MRMTTAPQTVETAWVCDECAGDGQLAYDPEATMWVPRSATADWPADDSIAISVLDCLQMRRHRHDAARSGRRQPSDKIRPVTPREPGCPARQSANRQTGLQNIGST